MILLKENYTFHKLSLPSFGALVGSFEDHFGASRADLGSKTQLKMGSEVLQEGFKNQPKTEPEKESQKLDF